MSAQHESPSLGYGFLGVFIAWICANPAPAVAIVASVLTAWAMWKRARAEEARRAYFERAAADDADALPDPE